MSILDRAITPQNPAIVNPAGRVPSASMVIGQPLENETPTQFFQRQMAQTPAAAETRATQTPPTPPPTETPPNSVVATRAPTDVPPIDYTKSQADAITDEILNDKKKEQPAATPPPVTETPEVPEEAAATTEASEEENSPEENFKRLRAANRGLEESVQEKERALTELTEKLSKYETGEVHAEVLEQQQREIERLKPFEAVVALKTSKEYDEAFVKPIQEKEAKIKAIAKDYDVPESVIMSALDMTNRKELGLFLSTHFADVDALEVKDIIKDIQGLQSKAQEAERAPQKALESLKAQAQVIREQTKAQRGSKIAAISKVGWSKAIDRIKQDGVLKAFIPDPADPKHNENVVGPISTAAAREYARIVRGLYDAGLEDLPEELAFALARMTQLAHSSAVHSDVAETAIKERNQVIETMKRRTPMNRPAIGVGHAGTSESAAPQKGLPSMKEQSTELLRKVGVKI